ncbi:hypothetical protein J6590_032659 [Homalodisca vitripennis]|nr:hypothetical protein J6590_032659 [Homalodisca vitripennis]
MIPGNTLRQTSRWLRKRRCPRPDSLAASESYTLYIHTGAAERGIRPTDLGADRRKEIRVYPRKRSRRAPGVMGTPQCKSDSTPIEVYGLETKF